MLKFWPEASIKLDPNLPLKERLRKLGIWHFDELQGLKYITQGF